MMDQQHNHYLDWHPKNVPCPDLRCFSPELSLPGLLFMSLPFHLRSVAAACFWTLNQAETGFFGAKLGWMGFQVQ